MGSGLCLAASLQSSGLCIPGAVQGFKGRWNMEYCRVTVSLAHTDPAGPSLLLEVPLGATGSFWGEQEHLNISLDI